MRFFKRVKKEEIPEVKLTFKQQSKVVLNLIKWIGLIAIIIYVGKSVAINAINDLTGTRVNINISVSYSSSGLLSPIVRANQ